MLKTKVRSWSFRRGSVKGLLVVLSAVIIAALAFANKRAILDHITVWQFEPSSAVQSLAEKSGMNNNGEFLYLASRPEIDDRSVFNSFCRDKDSTSAVLGCYVNNRIYIFNVTDKRLAGIKTTTAAHEMLHAAYSRLSLSQRSKVDSMVEDAYKSLTKEKVDALSERMSLYAKSEPGQRDNELHSVLGTEVADLPKELEDYYAQYFSDRTKVVEAHEQYQSVFEKLQKRADAIQKKMGTLQKQIESSTAQYTVDVAQIKTDISNFNQRAENGGFTSQNQFESERALLVARSSQLGARRAAINAKIEKYNALNKELSQVAEQDQALNQSVNSKLPEAPNV